MSMQKNQKFGGESEDRSGMGDEKEVYIYAEVDIDKAYNEILNKSKRMRNYLQEKGLGLEFTEKMRNYKNFVLVYVILENLFWLWDPELHS